MVRDFVLTVFGFLALFVGKIKDRGSEALINVVCKWITCKEIVALTNEFGNFGSQWVEST